MASIINVDQIGHSSSGNTALTVDSTGQVTATKPVIGSISVAVIADQKAYNVDGGGSSVGFNDRDLNTKIFDPDNIVSLASNQFTLNAGTYIIEFSSPAFRTNRMFTELYDVTNTASVGQGMCIYADNPYNNHGVSTGYAQVTLSASTTYKIRTYCQVDKTSNGLGVKNSLSTNNNIYTQVKITKLG